VTGSERFDRIVQSWDTASKATELSDFSVCTTWGVKGKDLFLLAVFRRRLECPALKRVVREQLSLFGANAVLSDVGNRVARSRRRSRAGPAPRYLTWFVPTSPDCEVKGARNSQAATIRVSMRYVTMGCSPGRRRGQGFAGFLPPARDCQTRVPVAILALRLATEVEEAA
jgi:hypothetical protein